MTAEVEVSSKFETEEKRALDMNANQDLPNGIDHSGNVNGNAKDDTDGSYVFVTQNDAVADDPAECVPVRPVNNEAEKDEGETGVVGDEKSQTGARDDGPAQQIGGEMEAVAAGEPGRIVDGAKIIEETEESKTVVSTGKELELPQAGNGNGEMNNLESTEEVEASPDTQVEIRDSSDHEIQETFNDEDEVQRQIGSELDANAEEKEFKILASEDAKPSGSDGNIDQGIESAESAPGSDHKLQADSRPLYGDHVHSGAVASSVSNEKRDDQLKDGAVTPGTVSLLNKKGNILSEADAVAENESCSLESGAIEVPGRVGNNDPESKSESVEVSASVENGDVKSESESVEMSACVQNSDVKLESGSVQVSSSVEGVNVKLESESIQVLSSVEHGDVKLESDSAEVSASVESHDEKLESVEVSRSVDSCDAGSEAGTANIPPSFENGATRSESQTLKDHASVENHDARIENEAAEGLASVNNGGVESDSKATSSPALDHDGNSREAASVSASNENDDFSATDPVKASISEAAPVNTLVDGEETSAEKSRSLGQSESANPPEAAVINTLVDAKETSAEKSASLGPAESAYPLVQCETISVEPDRNTDLTEKSTQGSSQDLGLEKAQNKKDELDSHSTAEFARGKRESSPTSHAQESVVVENIDNSATDEISKVLSPPGVCEGVKTESAEIHPAPRGGAVAGPDSETKASNTGENLAPNVSQAVGSETEAAQADVRSTMNNATEALSTKAACGSANGAATVSEALESHVVSCHISHSAANNCDEAKIELKGVREDTDNKSSHTAPCASSESETCGDVTKSEERTSTLPDNIVQKEFEAVVFGTYVDVTKPQEIRSILPENKVQKEVEAKLSETSFDGTKSEESRSNLPDNTETKEVKTEVSEKQADAGVENDTIGNEFISPSSPRDDAKSELEAESCSISERGSGNGIEPACVAANDPAINNGTLPPTDGHGEQAETAAPCEENSMVDASGRNNAAPEVERKPLLIRVPRYDDENLREQIRHAQLLVDQKTNSRDAIQAEIHNFKASCKEYRGNFDAVLTDERAARDLLRSKRQEINSHQFMIDRVRSAMSIEDIEVKIRNMEHMIEHETLPLKEEKQLIREIKQLKQLREQISSSMGRQEEVQQALDSKDQIEERLKVLRKEADSLRNNVLKAEAVTKVAKKKCHDESDKLNQLQDQFRAADAIRQEAYAQLQDLRKQLREKNKHFYKYKDDSSAAKELALKRDREALQHLCTEQVESFMNLWNNSEEFRKDYIRCNMRSTIRRFGTLDGRSLGPDEEPLTIPHVTGQRMDKDVNIMPPERVEKQGISSIALTQQKEVSSVEAEKVEDKIIVKSVEQKSQSAKPKKPVKSAPLAASGLATFSGREETEETSEEEHKLSKEEEEAASKAEELRKQEEAAKLKEQRRLEEIAKAKEAVERKKRIAEKNRMKAEIKAKKEAEEKEKEREKRLRKKEKKKAIISGTIVTEDTNNGTEEPSSLPSSETCAATQKEPEACEKPVTQLKRSKKPPQFSKQSKLKPIPPPLRNRGKRRMQPWMWVALVALLILALFVLGNGSLSLRSGAGSFGF